MATDPTIGVLALQGDVREHHRILRAHGAATIDVRRPEELLAVDGLVLPGGESTTMAKLAATFDLLEPLRKRIRAGMPAFGTCAGMILLADRIRDGAAGQQTIGGIDMTVRRNAFGRQVDSFEADVAFADIDAAQLAARAAAPTAAQQAARAAAPAVAHTATQAAPEEGAEPADPAHTFHAVFIRAPWVEEVGRECRVLARVASGPAAGRIVAVRQGHLLATAFHPELTGDSRVHHYFVDLVKEA